MSRFLVVYYSRTGYTRALAGELVAALGADVEPLDDGRDRCGFWGYWRCARDALKKRTPKLLPTSYDPEGYDVVVLGTPVWAGNVCSPLRSYVAAHQGRLGQVAFFCTQGGSGAEKVFRDLAELCGKAPLETLAVNDRDLNKHAYAARLERFTRTLAGAAGSQRPPGDAPTKPAATPGAPAAAALARAS